MASEDTPFTESPYSPGFAPECMACPIGLVMFAVKQSRPEVGEHLQKAALELFQAVRVLMDQYVERAERAQSIQRITID